MYTRIILYPSCIIINLLNIFVTDLFRLAYKLSLNEKYSKLAKVWFGPKLMVILMNPQDIEVFKYYNFIKSLNISTIAIAQ